MKSKKATTFLPPEGYTRLIGVLSTLGIGKTTLYRLIKEQKFPAPHKPFGGRISVWRVEDVRNFIDSRTEEEGDGK